VAETLATIIIAAALATIIRTAGIIIVVEVTAVATGVTTVTVIATLATIDKTVTAIWRPATIATRAIMVTTAIDGVGRGDEGRFLFILGKHAATLIMCMNQAIELIKSSVWVTINRGHEIIVGGVEAV
jgi:hypothetical protein